MDAQQRQEEESTPWNNGTETGRKETTGKEVFKYAQLEKHKI